MGLSGFVLVVLALVGLLIAWGIRGLWRKAYEERRINLSVMHPVSMKYFEVAVIYQHDGLPRVNFRGPGAATFGLSNWLLFRITHDDLGARLTPFSDFDVDEDMWTEKLTTLYDVNGKEITEPFRAILSNTPLTVKVTPGDGIESLYRLDVNAEQKPVSLSGVEEG